MKRYYLVIFMLIAFTTGFANHEVMPVWFVKAFQEQKLGAQYSLKMNAQPKFIYEDFNGDKIKDVVIQIIEVKSKKQGVLIMNGDSHHQAAIFGAGKKFTGEDFNDINWQSGWKLLKNYTAYETIFDKDGDIKGGKKTKLKYPALSIYKLEDGEEIAAVVIYWKGAKYVSIHEGE